MKIKEVPLTRSTRIILQFSRTLISGEIKKKKDAFFWDTLYVEVGMTNGIAGITVCDGIVL